MLRILFVGDNYIENEIRDFCGNTNADVQIIGEDLYEFINLMEENEYRCVVMHGADKTYEEINAFIDAAHRINPACRVLITIDSITFDNSKECILNGAEYMLQYPGDSDLFCAIVARLVERYEQETAIKKKLKEYEFNLLASGYVEGVGGCVLSIKNEKDKLFQVALVRILPPYRLRFNRRNDDLILLKGMETLEHDLGEVKGVTIIQKGQDFCVLMEGTKEELGGIVSRFESFLTNMNRVSYAYFKIGTWISFGSQVADVLKIRDSYAEAKDTMNERLILQSNFGFVEGSIIDNDDEANQRYLPMSTRQSLINAMEAFDESGIRQILILLKSQLDTSRGISGQSLYDLYKDVVSLFFLEADAHYGFMVDKRMTHEFVLKEFDYFWNIEDIFAFLLPLFVENAVNWKAQTDERDDPKIRAAKKYINEFYSMPISLDEVSNYVGLNASYFSDYFKKETGKTFSNYIADIRIKYAKQLLMNDKLSIEDVADSVGYNDKKYFSKVFKKETGFSPGEFRKMS